MSHAAAQQDIDADERKMQGLHEVFTNVFPIKDFSDRAEIDYVKYELEEPKYDMEECQQRDIAACEAVYVVRDAEAALIALCFLCG